ncbi:NAD-dependent epimerase/dehydratase family protein [Pseudomonas sp. AF03-9]|uniref:NAD-dependent epimerase/dehydratase family protein n=1 Tax=Pseudomonas sp. AF03-9 TaxID=2849867 RepID=UPI001CF9A20F|nr:NAD-dependent epimerase/dehydratase family protein [Pseudomonas sp. AF03-9]
MNILITGASGFIGERLLDAAITLWGKDSVTAFSSRKIEGCYSIVYNKSLPGFGLQAADLARIENVDVLIHAGAYTPKSGGEANIFSACNGNVYFTEELLKLPFSKLSRILFVSTLDVYASATPISELTPTVPATLYGWSKLYCEQMVSLFAREKKINHTILRVGHVYGPGEEKYAKFLPKTITSILAGGPVELYGDGAELRSFIYIDDVVTALLAAVDLAEQVSVINIVGGTAVSIKTVLDELVAISGRPVEIVRREFSGVKRDFVFDTMLLKKYLLPQETPFLLGLNAEFAYFESLK